MDIVNNLAWKYIEKFDSQKYEELVSKSSNTEDIYPGVVGLGFWIFFFLVFIGIILWFVNWFLIMFYSNEFCNDNILSMLILLQIIFMFCPFLTIILTIYIIYKGNKLRKNNSSPKCEEMIDTIEQY